ncbi:MAG: hypothetical protein V4530_16890 [Pseudomonadota bacterium]
MSNEVTKTIKFELSERNYLLLINALREVASGIADRELRTRVGGTADELNALGQRIRAQADQGDRNG